MVGNGTALEAVGDVEPGKSLALPINAVYTSANIFFSFTGYVYRFKKIITSPWSKFKKGPF